MRTPILCRTPLLGRALLLSFPLIFWPLPNSEHASCERSAAHAQDAESTRPASDLAEHPFAWLVGRWRGEGLGGIVEEVWTPELGGAMACMFRLTVGGKATMYELVTLSKSTGEWEMRLRHFNADLSAWEDKNGALRWPLEDMGPGYARFGPVLYELAEDGKLHAFVEIDGEGAPAELVMERS